MSTSPETSTWSSEEEIIAELPKNVYIEKKKVGKIAYEVANNIKKTWNPKDDTQKTYLRFLRDVPECSDHRTADWLFLLNTLNFSLWSENDTEEWKVNGFTGYYALRSAIKRTILDRNIAIYKPRNYERIRESEMRKLFLGDDGTCIPFIEKRLQILHNVGKILMQKFDGTFETCIKICNNNAIALMSLLTSVFECYRDRVIYKEKSVHLNTKAKILINDLQLYSLIEPTPSIMTTTIFADYRSLRVLFSFGALECTETFKEKLMRRKNLMAHGSIEELELRSCAMVAVKMICKGVQNILKDEIKYKNIKQSHVMIFVDNFLFSYRKQHEIGSKDVLEKCAFPDLNIDTVQY